MGKCRRRPVTSQLFMVCLGPRCSGMCRHGSACERGPPPEQGRPPEQHGAGALSLKFPPLGGFSRRTIVCVLTPGICWPLQCSPAQACCSVPAVQQYSSTPPCVPGLGCCTKHLARVWRGALRSHVAALLGEHARVSELLCAACARGRCARAWTACAAAARTATPARARAAPPSRWSALASTPTAPRSRRSATTGGRPPPWPRWSWRRCGAARGTVVHQGGCTCCDKPPLRDLADLLSTLTPSYPDNCSLQSRRSVTFISHRPLTASSAACVAEHSC